MEKPSENTNEELKWKNYDEQIAGENHSKSLDIAVTKYCKEKGPALDIGAGNLRDTKFLLNEGFTVTAIDPSSRSAEYVESLNNKSLTFVNEKLGRYDFPRDHFALINAQAILFHFSKPRFTNFMDSIKESLKSGGVFCGDFLGTKDSWNQQGTTKTFVTQQQIEEMFKDFDIKLYEEREEDANHASSVFDGTNETKHWHWIKIIAVKK